MTKKTAPERDLSKERILRCKPIAIELLKRLGAHDDLLVGDIAEHEDTAIEWYGTFYVKEIIPLFMEKDLTIDDSKFVFMLMQQAVAFAKGRTELTLDMGFEQATAKLYGVEHADEVKIMQVQNILIKAVKDAQGESVDKPVVEEEKKDVV